MKVYYPAVSTEIFLSLFCAKSMAPKIRHLTWQPTLPVQLWFMISHNSYVPLQQWNCQPSGCETCEQKRQLSHQSANDHAGKCMKVWIMFWISINLWGSGWLCIWRRNLDQFPVKRKPVCQSPKLYFKCRIKVQEFEWCELCRPNPQCQWRIYPYN